MMIAISTRSWFLLAPQRAVGDDAQIEPRQVFDQTADHGGPEASEAGPWLRRADQHIGAALLLGDLLDGLGQVVALLYEQMGAEYRGTLPMPSSWFRSSGVGLYPGFFTQSRSRSAPSLCADRKARRTSL